MMFLRLVLFLVSIGILLFTFMVPVPFLDATLFSYSPLCHAWKKSQGTAIGVPVFSPLDDRVAFTGITRVFRRQVGICTFPDGGAPLVVSQELNIYSTSSNGDEIPRLISSVSLNRNQDHNGDFGVWENDTFNIKVVSRHGGNTTTHYYKIDMNNGNTTVLSDEEAVRARINIYGQGRFSHTDPTLWLNYDQSMGISLFSGGKYSLNKKQQSIFQTLLPKTMLLRTIVSRETIETLHVKP